MIKKTSRADTIKAQIEALTMELNGLNTKVPEPLETPNFTELTKNVIYHITAVSKNQGVKNHKHYIFEEAINAIYGRDIWEWYNKQDISE